MLSLGQCSRVISRWAEESTRVPIDGEVGRRNVDTSAGIKRRRPATSGEYGA